VTLEIVQPLAISRVPKAVHFRGLAWKAGGVGTVRDRVPVLLVGLAAESA